MRREVGAACGDFRDDVENEHQTLIDLVTSFSPTSVLDIGCGDGALIAALAERGVRCEGIEPDPVSLTACRTRGVVVHEGRAEALEFADQAFDIAVFQHSLHHIEWIERALLEAARVTKTALLVMEASYALDFRSQQIALGFDALLKKLDRRSGMIHALSPTATELAGPLIAYGMHLTFQTQFSLRPASLTRVCKLVEERLAKVGQEADKLELSRLTDEARVAGLSQPGRLICIAEHALSSTAA